MNGEINKTFQYKWISTNPRKGSHKILSHFKMVLYGQYRLYFNNPKYIQYDFDNT